MDDYERRMFEDARKAYAALMACYPFGLDDLNDEEWRNFSEHYQISTYGRVKSFWGKTPKILKPQLHCTGYLCIGLRLNGKRKICRIHRLRIPTTSRKLITATGTRLIITCRT